MDEYCTPPPPDAYSTLAVPMRKHPHNGCRDHVSLKKRPLSCRCPPPTRSWSTTDLAILSDDGSNVGGSNGSDGRGPEEADCDSDDGEWSDSDDDDAGEDDDSGEEAEGDGRHSKRARPAP